MQRLAGRELSIHTGPTADLQRDSGAYRAAKGMWGSGGTRNSEVIPPTIQFHLPWLIGTYPRFQCKLLDVVVLMFSVMMAVAGAKEPQIAGRAAIRVLKQHMVKEPIFEAASSRSKELFAAAIGTTRDLSLRSGFVHGKTLYWGPHILRLNSNCARLVTL